jgi:hypothetical protein
MRDLITKKIAWHEPRMADNLLYLQNEKVSLPSATVPGKHKLTNVRKFEQTIGTLKTSDKYATY